MNKYVIILVMLLVLVGCNKKPYQANLSASNEQKQSTAIIRNEAKTIESVAPEVKPHTESIVAETQKIDKSSDKLEKAVIAAQNEAKAAKESENKWMNRTISAMILAGILGVTVTVALLLMGYIKSFLATSIAIAVAVAGITLKFLMAYILWVGGILGVILAGFIIYAIVRYIKSNKQIIKSVQIGKNEGVIGEKFGEIANEKQDKVTQNLVAKVKKKIVKEIQKEKSSGAGQ